MNFLFLSAFFKNFSQSILQQQLVAILFTCLLSLHICSSSYQYESDSHIHHSSIIPNYHPCQHIANKLHSNASFSSLCRRFLYSEVLVDTDFEIYACLSNYESAYMSDHQEDSKAKTEMGMYSPYYQSYSLIGRVFNRDNPDTRGNDFSELPESSSYSIDFDHGKSSDMGSHLCFSGKARFNLLT